MLRYLREPVNGLTHLAGALLSLAGLPFLLDAATSRGTVWHQISFAVFGVSMTLLYTASTLYHSLPLSPRGIRRLRRLDHMMIFVLIAGTYTPLCMVPLRDGIGPRLLTFIWTVAALGMVMKVFWLHAPRWLYLGVYLAMSWLAVVTFHPLYLALPKDALVWLGAGGLFYTVGALVYGLKWPNLSKSWGFHEVWHLFVLAGSFAHFYAVLRYV